MMSIRISSGGSRPAPCAASIRRAVAHLPDVPPAAKRIEVNITAQTLTAYEYDIPVLATRLSSGGVYFNADGSVYRYPTPWGEHYVQRKAPSRHMIGGQAINQPYNLPGVPWCTYFAPTGEAIHGATTHNDFGHPRSHGCLNVATDAAKWLYRWTTPAVAYDDAFYWLPAEDRALATSILITGAA
jgi:lipoprotein-anchoring transpeptidase ErfK/SrfK